MADATDLKSVIRKGCEGSTPSLGTLQLSCNNHESRILNLETLHYSYAIQVFRYACV